MSVYVIECAGLLKIGYSKNPEQRMAKLFQSTSRYAAPRAAYLARGTQRLIHVIDGATKDDETHIHRALEDYSLGCEWFVNEPAVLDFVRNHKPDDLPDELVRPDGSVYEQTPYADRGGCNAELVMSVYSKRLERT